MSKKLRKGDLVLVIAGNDKGKSGAILSRTKDRVLVQGINVRKKHLRPTQETQGQGRVVDIEVPIHISNVALCDKEQKKLGRIQVRQNKEGAREFVYGKGDQKKVYRSVKKPA